MRKYECVCVCVCVCSCVCVHVCIMGAEWARRSWVCESDTDDLPPRVASHALLDVAIKTQDTNIHLFVCESLTLLYIVCFI